MISAGRVLLMPKGAYDASTTYELLDIVSYNGSSYIAKGTTTGNLPTNTTYWQLSAYGGNAANVASNFAELETTSIAVAVHNVDDLFIDENSQLMITTQKINIGDSIVSGTNCTPTSVETLLNNIATYFANLDATDRKLKAIAEIEVQTDLHTLTIGEYFKSDTSFYVTNAPTGIDSEITAVFRLTVEAAYDDEGALNAPMLFTLRTLNGKVYKQAFDGANWSSWAQEATEAEINTLQYDDIQIQQLVANFQGTLTANKNYSAGDHFVYQYNEYELDSSVSSGSALVIGTNCHATGDVSSQIQTLSNQCNNISDVIGRNGAKNLLPNTATSQVITGVTFTVNSDGTVTANAPSGATDASLFAVSTKTYSKGTYRLSGCPSGGSLYNTYLLEAVVNGTHYFDYGNGIEFTLDTDSSVLVDIVVYQPIGAFSNVVFKPMLTLADQPNSDYAHYVPYAKTNRELTDDISTIKGMPYDLLASASATQNNITIPDINQYRYIIASCGTIGANKNNLINPAIIPVSLFKQLEYVYSGYAGTSAGNIVVVAMSTTYISDTSIRIYVNGSTDALVYGVK